MNEKIKPFDLLNTAGNPRNSEGAFLRTGDGRTRYIYTRYSGGNWSDDAHADLAELISTDDGDSWRDNGVVIPRGDADNVMSVSLLRLRNGSVILFYLEKRMLACGRMACLPMIRRSTDDGDTWSEARRLIARDGYFVMDNDRAVQLESGRIVLPFSYHLFREGRWEFRPGMLFTLISDDNGETWRESESLVCPDTRADGFHGFQEPVVIELAPDHLRMWARTALGYQFTTDSFDGGNNWGAAVPDRNFPSPLSPLSVKRDPATGWLYAVWNGIDRQLYPVLPLPTGSDRTPLVIMRSRDNGATWDRREGVMLEREPDRGYCYTAMHFCGSDLLLAYCFGVQAPGRCVLQDLRLRKLHLPDLWPDQA